MPAFLNVTPLQVRALRANRTQQTFAELVGVSVQTIRNWETGRTRPMGANLLRLQALADNDSPEWRHGLILASDEALIEELRRRMSRRS